uniref:Reverse transcriptase zinc-binding domain-containing protein n=1 Tax=Opuntia streptacantha TaxID=393608 RepID=A0A7C9D869_OPUST
MTKRRGKYEEEQLGEFLQSNVFLKFISKIHSCTHILVFSLCFSSPLVTLGYCVIQMFPTKVCFFAWAATKGNIPTEDVLKRRNFSGPSRCYVCLEERESVNHLLVNCRWVSSLCDLSLSLMGVSWVQTSNVRDVVAAWRRRMQKRWVLGFGNMIPLSIWWATLKEGNRRIFEDKASSFQAFKLYF